MSDVFIPSIKSIILECPRDEENLSSPFISRRQGERSDLHETIDDILDGLVPHVQEPTQYNKYNK